MPTPTSSCFRSHRSARGAGPRALAFAASGLLTIGLVGCGAPSPSSEAKVGYAAVVADPLWQHHPDATTFTEGLVEDEPYCAAETHSSDFSGITPSRSYEGPALTEPRALLDEYVALAEAHGWRLTEPGAGGRDDERGEGELVGSDEYEMWATVTKEFDGHLARVRLEVQAGEEWTSVSLHAVIPSADTGC